ncbi:synaptonemal complex protein, putative [Entamoeba invadens IP1]|uniref:synaptonemal complex protein, putative n=1 Tax=Entamoeba invadens IP1 TaxID=370355 RepID=UPI0002C3DF64|nr:synaptonemal complex protein, putative [Entamoeba invadens IP1]ELP93404.1 synaptonemal complex protein, putative [Entamoeba invadens IP1]|eukprot:XP_004260175.1 synaptonemal complex protein, putative [Entamoeba invadens IP1]
MDVVGLCQVKSTNPDALYIERGDIINVTEITTSGLWKGKSAHGSGLFSVLSTTLERPPLYQGKVLYDFVMKNSECLSVHSNDYVTVCEEDGEEDGWVFCKIGTRFGFVPKKYIERIDFTKNIGKNRMRMTQQVSVASHLPSRLPCKVIGKYEYVASYGKDISFHKDDEMVCLSASDNRWILVIHPEYGIGYVPLLYVTCDKSFLTMEIHKFAVALYDFEGESRFHLSAQVGDVMYVESVIGSWAIVRVNETKYIYPYSFLHVFEDENDLKISESLGFILEKFTPVNENEIEVNKNDFVVILLKETNGWTLVRHDNKVGYVPTDFIEKIDEGDRYAMITCKSQCEVFEYAEKFKKTETSTEETVKGQIEEKEKTEVQEEQQTEEDTTVSKESIKEIESVIIEETKDQFESIENNQQENTEPTELKEEEQGTQDESPKEVIQDEKSQSDETKDTTDVQLTVNTQQQITKKKIETSEGDIWIVFKKIDEETFVGKRGPLLVVLFLNDVELRNLEKPMNPEYEKGRKRLEDKEREFEENVKLHDEKEKERKRAEEGQKAEEELKQKKETEKAFLRQTMQLKKQQTRATGFRKEGFKRPNVIDPQQLELTKSLYEESLLDKSNEKVSSDLTKIEQLKIELKKDHMNKEIIENGIKEILAQNGKLKKRTTDLEDGGKAILKVIETLKDELKKTREAKESKQTFVPVDPTNQSSTTTTDIITTPNTVQPQTKRFVGRTRTDSETNSLRAQIEELKKEVEELKKKDQAIVSVENPNLTVDGVKEEEIVVQNKEVSEDNVNGICKDNVKITEEEKKDETREDSKETITEGTSATLEKVEQIVDNTVGIEPSNEQPNVQQEQQITETPFKDERDNQIKTLMDENEQLKKMIEELQKVPLKEEQAKGGNDDKKVDTQAEPLKSVTGPGSLISSENTSFISFEPSSGEQSQDEGASSDIELLKKQLSEEKLEHKQLKQEFQNFKMKNESKSSQLRRQTVPVKPIEVSPNVTQAELIEFEHKIEEKVKAIKQQLSKITTQTNKLSRQSSLTNINSLKTETTEKLGVYKDQLKVLERKLSMMSKSQNF